MIEEQTAPELLRKAHVVEGTELRLLKAHKICRVLSNYISLEGKRLLDIGAGTGEIAQYFQSIGCHVAAVDREDSIDSEVDVAFHKVEGTRLPFEKERFDVVIYNHVIEHVGERPEQFAHLMEIARVMAQDGVLYLAVPNCWSVIEPHYGLPFLSWLPTAWASRYVRATGRHTWYDCRPFPRRELMALMREAGFVVCDETETVLEIYLQIESTRSRKLRLAAAAPKFLRRLFMPIVPTLIMVGRRDRLAG